jgi:hypothetical protein
MCQKLAGGQWRFRRYYVFVELRVVPRIRNCRTTYCRKQGNRHNVETQIADIYAEKMTITLVFKENRQNVLPKIGENRRES